MVRDAFLYSLQNLYCFETWIFLATVDPRRPRVLTRCSSDNEEAE